MILAADNSLVGMQLGILLGPQAGSTGQNGGENHAKHQQMVTGYMFSSSGVPRLKAGVQKVQ